MRLIPKLKNLWRLRHFNERQHSELQKGPKNDLKESAKKAPQKLPVGELLRNIEANNHIDGNSLVRKWFKIEFKVEFPHSLRCLRKGERWAKNTEENSFWAPVYGCSSMMNNLKIKDNKKPEYQCHRQALSQNTEVRNLNELVFGTHLKGWTTISAVRRSAEPIH